MTAQEFVAVVRKEMITKVLERYRHVLDSADRDAVKDPVWREVVHGWDTLNAKQRKAVLRFVRLAIVDTLSYVFGVLDNTSFLDRYRDRFILEYGSKREKVSGDLQDYFLAAEEDEPEEA